MKRSSQVGLLLMGTLAVGGGAYAVMPHENCQPGVVQPDGQLSQASQNCNRSWGSSSGGGSHYYSGSSSSSSSTSSHPSYFASDGRTILGSSTGGDHSSSGSSSSVARGGFGSFASHFSGGG
jgi:hypothetical protein